MIPPKAVGCPIRRSRDHRALAPPPSFSQRATSFIASRCQGIHPMPFRCLIPLWAPRAGANPHADTEGCIVCDRTPGVFARTVRLSLTGAVGRVRVDDADLPVNLGQSQNLLHMSKIEPGSGPRAGRARRLRGRDLNPRPSGYEPDELPGCSTPRQDFCDDGRASPVGRWCGWRARRRPPLPPLAGAVPGALRAFTAEFGMASGCFVPRHGHRAGQPHRTRARVRCPPCRRKRSRRDEQAAAAGPRASAGGSPVDGRLRGP